MMLSFWKKHCHVIQAFIKSMMESVFLWWRSVFLLLPHWYSEGHMLRWLLIVHQSYTVVFCRLTANLASCTHLLRLGARKISRSERETVSTGATNWLYLTNKKNELQSTGSEGIFYYCCSIENVNLKGHFYPFSYKRLNKIRWYLSLY